MASINVPSRTEKVYTHGGAVASRTPDSLTLRRLVLANMLWEDQFYCDGKDTAKLIQELIPKVKPEVVSSLAAQARRDYKLRHVPMLLARELARGNKEARAFVASTLAEIIQRADELAEFLAIYWKDKRQPLSAQVKKGLARAFTKFSEYDLAKYNRDNAIRLRDVLFLTHPKPKTQDQQNVWNKLVEKNLTTPDTWEVNLSAGADKKETFIRLINERKLGALALLRNLRNMTTVGVPDDVIREALRTMKVERVLPFRFLTAARYAPRFEPELEQAMYKCVEDAQKLRGKTVLIVDVSGSMSGGLSGKSELNRVDAAIALSILIRELSEDCKVYCTAGNDWNGVHKTELIPARRGFALGDAIKKAMATLGGGGIFLTQCTDYTANLEKTADRVIVITDEQDTDKKLNPSKAKPYGKFNYILNIASYKNGIGFGQWQKVDGFSEASIDYIIESEKLESDFLQ